MQPTYHRYINHSWPADLFDPRAPEDDRPHLIFADPPYNQGVQYADDPTADRLSPYSYLALTRSIIDTLLLTLRPDGFLFYLLPAHHSKLLHAFDYPPPIVIHETFSQYQGNNGRLTTDYRLLYILSPNSADGRIVPNPDAIRIPSRRQELGDSRADQRGRVPGMVWNVPRLPGNAHIRCDWHPCQLHPLLLNRIVEGWTSPGQTVMDAFGGSNSLGKVCAASGRNFIYVDQSPTYTQRAYEEILPCSDTLLITNVSRESLTPLPPLSSLHPSSSESLLPPVQNSPTLLGLPALTPSEPTSSDSLSLGTSSST